MNESPFWLLDFSNAVPAALSCLGLALGIVVLIYVYEESFKKAKHTGAIRGIIFKYALGAMLLATLIGVTGSTTSSPDDDPIYGSKTGEVVHLRTPDKANLLAWKIFILFSGASAIGAIRGKKEYTPVSMTLVA